MLKISDSIKELIAEEQFLQIGISNGLFNLTRLAAFIQPLVEAKTKKPVTVSAILMGLSRLNRNINHPPALEQWTGVQSDRIAVNTGLSVRAYLKSDDSRKFVHSIYNRLAKEGSYATLTEGTSEITLIVETRKLYLLRKHSTAELISQHDNLGSVAIRLRRPGEDKPGILYLILQQLAFQRINIVEVASTASEFIIYLSELDLQLGFDTLYRCIRRGGNPVLDYSESK